MFTASLPEVTSEVVALIIAALLFGLTGLRKLIAKKKQTGMSELLKISEAMLAMSCWFERRRRM